MKHDNLQELQLDEIKKIQLEITDEIHDFCKQKGIKYYILGGTLLGAIRHKGYIPWDDDIDIGLFREDYEYLLKNFVSRSGTVELVNHENKKGYNLVYAKAISNKTILYEGGNYNVKLGVNIDVFPLEKMPVSEIKRSFMLNILIIIKNTLTLKHIRLRKNRALKKNLIVLLGKVLCLMPDKVLIKAFNSICRILSCKDNDYTYICNCCGAWGKKELVLRECIDDVILVDFEERKYFAPQKYDMYLKCIYGDYMVLPPEEKRISHHDYVAYWNSME